jgi:transcriptional antiterminator RfaH
LECDVQGEEGAIWLVVKTRARQEERARENLERQDFEVYLPKLQVPRRVRDQWRKVTEPLFPGYLFIRTNPHEVSLSPVRSTFGVSGVVRFGQQVVPMPDDIIGFLRQREIDDAGPELLETLPFRRGDKVDVLSGAFAGLSAVYQMPKGRDRAVLLVSLLGRENGVTVPFDHIAPAG